MQQTTVTAVELNELDLERVAAGSDKDDGAFVAKGRRGTVVAKG